VRSSAARRHVKIDGAYARRSAMIVPVGTRKLLVIEKRTA
jgi:hypothetical protein